MFLYKFKIQLVLSSLLWYDIILYQIINTYNVFFISLEDKIIHNYLVFKTPSNKMFFYVGIATHRTVTSNFTLDLILPKIIGVERNDF